MIDITPLLADLAAVSLRVPTIRFEPLAAGRVLMIVDSGSTRPIPVGEGRDSESLVEVAEELGSIVDDDETVSWPMCETHGWTRCTAHVVDGTAVWWCRPGTHLICAMGRLATVRRR